MRSFRERACAAVTAATSACPATGRAGTATAPPVLLATPLMLTNGLLRWHIVTGALDFDATDSRTGLLLAGPARTTLPAGRAAAPDTANDGILWRRGPAKDKRSNQLVRFSSQGSMRSFQTLPTMHGVLVKYAKSKKLRVNLYVSMERPLMNHIRLGGCSTRKFSDPLQTSPHLNL